MNICGGSCCGCVEGAKPGPNGGGAVGIGSWFVIVRFSIFSNLAVRTVYRSAVGDRKSMVVGSDWKDEKSVLWVVQLLSGKRRGMTPILDASLGTAWGHVLLLRTRSIILLNSEVLHEYY